MTDYRKWMLPSAGASIPKGDYVAYVEASWIRWVNAQATLSLRLVCKSKTRICQTVVHFLIHQRDQAAQWRERSRLRSIAVAIGLEVFDDSDQLHGRPFRMIVWNANPLRISFRSIADAWKVGSGGQRLSGGDDGPRAA